MSNALKAKIVFVAGSTGTGKSHWLFRQITKPARRRLVVWSPKEEIDNYAGRLGAVVVTSANALLDAMSAKTFRVVVVPPLDRKRAVPFFDTACQALLKARNLCFVAEEIHTVTMPSWAPAGWSQLTMMGRGFGCEIWAISQRPASVDKDFFAQCTLVHSGRLGYEEDAKVMAKSLHVKPAELMALPDYHFIERDPQSASQPVRGVTKA